MGKDRAAVALIERYARAESMERKDVVNLAFHEFFERRQYIPPKDGPTNQGWDSQRPMNDKTLS